MAAGDSPPRLLRRDEQGRRGQMRAVVSAVVPRLLQRAKGEAARAATLAAALGEGEVTTTTVREEEGGTDMANRVAPSAGANTANGGGPKQVTCRWMAADPKGMGNEPGHGWGIRDLAL